MPRYINDIIIHSTRTLPDPTIDAEALTGWDRERGRRGCSYHYIVKVDGTVERGRAISQPGAHCHGHNAHSIGIVYVGGAAEDGSGADTRTRAQKESLLQLTARLVKMYRCQVHGSDEYQNQNEPGFDVQSEYGSLYSQLCKI